MKIHVNQIPPEGTELEEEVSAAALDVETEIVKFRKPLVIQARIVRITNAVTLELSLTASRIMTCSRCLEEFETVFDKNLRLHYQVQKADEVIDIAPDIREEIILGYPINPLCSPRCKGLCPICGKNLNEGTCNCNITHTQERS